MQRTIDETNRRRTKQLAYNEAHGITPKQIQKAASAVWQDQQKEEKVYTESDEVDVAADPVVQYMSAEALEKAIAKLKSQMKKASKNLDFIEAARLRDEMYQYQELLKKRQ